MVVGMVGAAVPAELVLAAGLEAVRLSGRPRDTPHLEAYGFEELDVATAAVLEQLLAGGHGVDFVLIAGDTAAQTMLFKILRELRRVDPASPLPPFAFLDLLHLPYRTTARYNRRQLVRICHVLAGWAGTGVTGERIRAAVERVNNNRRLFGEIARLRRARPASLTGVEALRLVADALVSSPETTQRRLVEVLDREPRLPPRDGKRVYLTGSAHEDDSIYRAIEARGYLIVGEDHPRGEAAFAGEVATTRDPLDGLVDHYQHAPLPARRSSAERAAYVAGQARLAQADLVVCFVHGDDAATPWDLPAIRGAARDAGLPLVEVAPGEVGSL